MLDYDALEKKRELEKLKSEIELLSGTSTDVIYRLRYETMRYDYISPSVVKLLGFTEEELQEINLRSLIMETRMVAENMRKVDDFEGLEATRKRGEVLKWQADYQMKTKDGRSIWVSDVSYPWFDEKGAIIGSLGTLRDISDRVLAEEQIKAQATRLRHEDEVTRLPSRLVFFERLEDEVKRLKRSRSDVAVMIVSIDHFDGILNKHGIEASHMVLREVAALTRAAMRETDLAARITSDEFGVVLPDTPVEGAYWVGERIRGNVIKHQFRTVSGELLGVTVSVGVSGARFDHNTKGRELFKTAESRLYVAKCTGKNQVSVDELVSIH